MRLIEVIMAMGILVVFTALTAGIVMTGANLYEETCRIEYGLDRDKFMKDGFLVMCSQLNEVDGRNKDGWFVKSGEWKRLCHSMWGLERLDLEITNEGYCQTWTADGKTMRVVFRVNGGSDFGLE